MRLGLRDMRKDIVLLDVPRARSYVTSRDKRFCDEPVAYLNVFICRFYSIPVAQVNHRLFLNLYK